jgi:predicted acylesterase/phospholipase RssA
MKIVFLIFSARLMTGNEVIVVLSGGGAKGAAHAGALKVRLG